ncbi:MAG: nucleoside deaminase [Bacteroidota bacterium]
MPIDRVDEHFMLIALQEAKKAYALGEVPIGALIVQHNSIIAQGHNLVQESQNATTHAELLVIQKACTIKKKKYLPEATLYATLEPCPMCAMACFWTQIKRIVWGAQDPKRGYSIWSPSLLLPKVVVTKGILAKQSSQLLKQFFQELRNKHSQ